MVVPSSPTNGGGTDCGEHAEPALEEHDIHQHLALDRAFRGVDVGHRHRAILNQGLDLAERATEHTRDVRLLVALGEANRLTQIVLFEELGELGRELARLDLRLPQHPPLLDHDGQREDRHDQEHGGNALGEPTHRIKEVDQRQIHLGVLESGAG